MNTLTISHLTGKTLISAENTGYEIIFETNEGERFRLFHEQDCCESVYVESVVGVLADLVGTPILSAEEVSNEGAPVLNGEYVDSYTWTFYKLATIKGYVDIRFLGESNGYYSESVDFEQINAGGAE